MKKVVTILLLIAVMFICIAQEPVQSGDKPGYTHGEVAAIGLSPYFSTVVSLGTYGFLPEKARYPFLYGTSLLGNIPGCITNFPLGLSETAMEAGTIATGMFFNKLPYVAEVFYNAGWKSTWWTQYDAYAKARAECDWYPDYRQLSFADALISPFNPQILKRNEVWIPILAGSLLSVGTSFLGDTSNAVWNTGKAYLGDTEVPVLAGLGATLLLTGVSMAFTAVGEEALFRGIGYEEFKLNYGKIPAILLDAVLFSAVHIPQEALSGMNIYEVLLNFGIRVGISCALEWIYDQGGLESSIAFHMWYNTIASLTNYLFTGGKAASAETGNIGNNSTAMNIGLTPEGFNLSLCFSF